jgi:ADP-ribosylglycohydrolase
MLSAITGDIIGSIHENIPNKKNTRDAGPTDDSFLTCACYEWVHSLNLESIKSLKNDSDIRQNFKEQATFYLKKWWAKYPGEGFSRGFNAWAASPEFIQAHRDTNGCLMRQSPIPEFCVKNKIDLDICLLLCKIFASPTHDQPDSYEAVKSHGKTIYCTQNKSVHPHDLKYLMENTSYKIQPLDYWKDMKKFIWDAKSSLAIAYSALYHASNFETTIENCIYIGGDVDTYCAIACPMAVATWPIPESIANNVSNILVEFPDIEKLFNN